ncbi:FUSC family protein [Fastidiosibacter lacustris]|uniref:FUSC family protein n=1 Tax=Fastidiosibacter lacustris TaxID=2056695 RepID=UPI000E354E06|nr:FUSC family protein [Fastidiosibacter lacustris]
MTLGSNVYSSINAIKAVIATVIGYLVGCWLGFWLDVPEMYAWIVVTILVVMSSQPNLGGALEKAKMRFLGTIVATLCSIVILLLMPGFPIWQMMLGLCLIAVGVFTATASTKYMYAGVLGAITIAIILFGSRASLEIAIYRASEVFIGITIAIIVNRYLFPIRASRRIYQSFSQSMMCINKLHQKLFVGDDHEDILVEIFTHFSKQITLQKEIVYEKEKIHLKQYKATTRYLRQLYRYTCVIYEYINRYPKKRERFANSNEFKALHEAIRVLFEKISNSFKQQKFDDYSDDFKCLTKLLAAFTETLNIQVEFRYASTLIFSLNMIVDTLQAIEKTQNLKTDSLQNHS